VFPVARWYGRRSSNRGVEVQLALLLVRLGLGGVFVVAAVGKLADREGSRLAVKRFGVPVALIGAVSTALPVLELVIAIGLVVPASAAAAAVIAGVLLLMFCAAIVRLLARGEAPDCHCFGSVGSAPVGRGTLARDGALVALAGFVAVSGWNHGGESVSRLAVDLGAGAIVVGVVLVLQMAFSWQLFQQNGRLLERVSDLEAGAGRRSGGEVDGKLVIGDRAPWFALPDLDGRPVSLEELLSPGRGVVLVFTDPACGHCNALLPVLGRPRGAHQPPLAVISRGPHDENYTKAQEHGIASVLLQQNFEVAEAYGTYGMPSAFLIDAAGRIASPRAGGADAVADLLETALGPHLSLMHVGPARAPVYEEARGS
jgi:uncharacterized membrane protein YphA (DoxX/SURF4 family)/peroxiredoxin